MNIERMRRHIYRSVPDRVVFSIDVFTMVASPPWFEDEYQAALADFRKAMRVKHREEVPITVMEEELMAKHPGERVFVFRAYPDRR